MKATLKETSTITIPEKRIWIVEYQQVSFTFKLKKSAKEFKTILDENTPIITIKK